MTESDSSLLKSGFSFCDCGMIIRVRWSKTIQFRERVLEILAAVMFSYARFTGPRGCFRQMGAGQGDIAFSLPAARGSVPLMYKVYQRTLKIFSNIAGLGEFDFTSYSLRREACTYLAMWGARCEGTG